MWEPWQLQWFKECLPLIGILATRLAGHLDRTFALCKPNFKVSGFFANPVVSHFLRSKIHCVYIYIFFFIFLCLAMKSLQMSCKQRQPDIITTGLWTFSGDAQHTTAEQHQRLYAGDREEDGSDGQLLRAAPLHALQLGEGRHHHQSQPKPHPH